jgi:hypothetical protein
MKDIYIGTQSFRLASGEIVDVECEEGALEGLRMGQPCEVIREDDGDYTVSFIHRKTRMGVIAPVTVRPSKFALTHTATDTGPKA